MADFTLDREHLFNSTQITMSDVYALTYKHITRDMWDSLNNVKFMTDSQGQILWIGAVGTYDNDAKSVNWAHVTDLHLWKIQGDPEKARAFFETLRKKWIGQTGNAWHFGIHGKAPHHYDPERHHPDNILKRRIENIRLAEEQKKADAKEKARKTREFNKLILKMDFVTIQGVLDAIVKGKTDGKRCIHLKCNTFLDGMHAARILTQRGHGKRLSKFEKKNVFHLSIDLKD